MVLRFANGMFEPIWNRHHIDHVQITVAETVSVENRGKFYDHTGALRDMVPNHLFQLLALTAMEPPSCFEAAAVRAEKLKAIEAIHPLTREKVLSRRGARPIRRRARRRQGRVRLPRGGRRRAAERDRNLCRHAACDR